MPESEHNILNDHRDSRCGSRFAVGNFTILTAGIRRMLCVMGVCLLIAATIGCASSKKDVGKPGPYGMPASDQNDTGKPDSTKHQSNAQDAARPAARMLAYVGGQPVSADAMFPLLLNYAGGQVLSQMILDMQLDRQLTQRRVIISPDMIEAERQSLLDELSNEPDEAVRLLKQLRQNRGVTNDRFTQTLKRNAALRALTRDKINVTEQDLHLAFDMAHGQKYEARLITTRSLNQMQQILAKLDKNASFVDLAIASSTDPSSAQGGLLPAISEADVSYPAAVRNVLVTLKPGQVSNPIALDNSYAILRLERKIQGDNVKFVDVKNTLTLIVQRQQQQTQMRLLARSLLEDADVVVLDPVLKESWDRQKELMSQNP